MNTKLAAGAALRLNPSIQPICAFFRQYWRAFQEGRSRRKLRAALYELNDQDLKDIGISRGSIEYVASNPTADPRYIRPGSLTSA